MDYRKAIEIAQGFLADDADDPEALTILGRVHAGAGQIEEAHKTYSYIYKHKKFSPGMHAEAALVLDRPAEARTILHKALTKTPDHPDLLFLAGIAEYQLGHITRVTELLLTAIESGLDWNDEDPITLVVEHCLSGPEFMDLEHIYLDCQNQLFEGKTGSQNRWFSLNLSIYEMYTATTLDRRKKRAIELMELLIGKNILTLEEGPQKLTKIFSDFSKNEKDIRFGLEGLKFLETQKYDQIARMVIGLQLEHLKEFSAILDIKPEEVDNRSMQVLATQLPLRVATALLTLYGIATTEDRLAQLMKQEIEPYILATLITACFSSFYTEIDLYKNRQRLLS